MKMSVAQIIPRYLKELGVHHIFGVVGHSTLVLTDAIYQEPDVEYIPAQIELSAAYMADGYARTNRSLGVCLASAGAGVTNLLTGVAQSFKESVPVLALGSDVTEVFQWYEPRGVYGEHCHHRWCGRTSRCYGLSHVFGVGGYTSTDASCLCSSYEPGCRRDP